MPLLSDIQQDIMEEKPLALILLKLRFLASRLGSDVLEDWVRLEIDGYGKGEEVPPYRELDVTYTADFIGPFGSSMTNAPVPPYIIEKVAGKNALRLSERQSVSAIENLIESVSTKGGSLYMNASNLILMLQGKMYPEMNCVSATGKISVGSVVALLGSVRSRVLELTIQIEKSVPLASTVTFGKSSQNSPSEAGHVTHITNQVVYGNLTSVSNSNQTNVEDSSKNKNTRLSDDALISEIHQALAQANINQEKLAQIMAAIDELRSARDKPSRMSAYNHIVAVCADHMGIVSPFLDPLKKMFLGS